jgi:hypothetical protein
MITAYKMVLWYSLPSTLSTYKYAPHTSCILSYALLSYQLHTRCFPLWRILIFMLSGYHPCTIYMLTYIHLTQPYTSRATTYPPSLLPDPCTLPTPYPQPQPGSVKGCSQTEGTNIYLLRKRSGAESPNERANLQGLQYQSCLQVKAKTDLNKPFQQNAMSYKAYKAPRSTVQSEKKPASPPSSPWGRRCHRWGGNRHPAKRWNAHSPPSLGNAVGKRLRWTQPSCGTPNPNRTNQYKPIQNICIICFHDMWQYVAIASWHIMTHQHVTYKHTKVRRKDQSGWVNHIVWPQILEGRSTMLQT